MKRKNTLWSLVLALVMVLGVFAPLSALAAETPGFPQGTDTPADLKVTLKETDVQTTKPDETPVTVHKLQADKYADGIGIGFKHNGGKIATDDDGNYPAALGTNVKELNGVSFTYYKLKDAAQLKEFIDDKSNLTTTEQVEAKNLTAVGTITTANGQGATVNLPDGYYWFVESGYDKPEDGPDITSSIAVPFWLSIPVMNKEKVGDHAEGTVYLKQVHVYPKNVTGKDSVPTKTVDNEVNLNSKHNVGDTQTWYLQATIPANIQDYESFVMKDTFFKGLTYVGNVKVSMGYDGNISQVELAKGTDYTLVEPAKDTKFTTDIPSDADLKDQTKRVEDPTNAKEKFSVTLTAAGLQKLVDNYKTVSDAAKKANKEVKLYATVDTVINEDAKMGTMIPNTYDLITKIKGKDEKKKKPETPPTVETGGKKFIKVSESDKNTKLAGAVFSLFDGSKQMTWTQALIDANKTAIEAGKFAKDENGTKLTVADAEAAVKGTTPLNIYLMSITDGTFEIKGLEYSSWELTKLDGSKETKTHDYKLKEVKFPENYAGNKDTEYKFTVDAKSYYSNTDVFNKDPNTELKDADPLQITNKDLTIPPTGGMGTVIFVVAGMALMGGAFIAMRKRSAEQA